MSKANQKNTQALLGTILAFASCTAYALDTLCTTTEKVIFNCQLKESKKLVSVCGSKPLTRDSGYIQYRFGTKQYLELIYPSKKTESQKRFFGGYQHPYQSSIAELTFENGGYSYTLSAYSVSEVLNDIPGGAEFGEITIQKRGASNYKTLKCTKYPDGEFYLEGIVRDAEELIDAKP